MSPSDKHKMVLPLNIFFIQHIYLKFDILWQKQIFVNLQNIWGQMLIFATSGLAHLMGETLHAVDAQGHDPLSINSAMQR